VGAAADASVVAVEPPPPPQAESHNKAVITPAVWSARAVAAFVWHTVSGVEEMFMR
jgi:hypothetical protein